MKRHTEMSGRKLKIESILYSGMGACTFDAYTFTSLSNRTRVWVFFRYNTYSCPHTFRWCSAFLCRRGRSKGDSGKGVDWWTLLYFLFLLPAIASLEYTGITHKLSVYMSGILNTVHLQLCFLCWYFLL